MFDRGVGSVHDRVRPVGNGAGRGGYYNVPLRCADIYTQDQYWQK
jgi:hypothetical protein